MQQPLYTVKQVADILRLSKSAVYKLAEKNELNHFKFGSVLRFSESHLNDLLGRCEHRSQQSK